jgi:hypothetical protein
MPSMQSSAYRSLFIIGLLVGFLFDPEDGSDMFLQNVSRILPNNTALLPR